MAFLKENWFKLALVLLAVIYIYFSQVKQSTKDSYQSGLDKPHIRDNREQSYQQALNTATTSEGQTQAYRELLRYRQEEAAKIRAQLGL